MKVYDTDEKAIATGARRRLLARVLQGVMMAAFAGLGLWIFYQVVLAPESAARWYSPVVVAVEDLSMPSQVTSIVYLPEPREICESCLCFDHIKQKTHASLVFC